MKICIRDILLLNFNNNLIIIFPNKNKMLFPIVLSTFLEFTETNIFGSKSYSSNIYSKITKKNKIKEFYIQLIYVCVCERQIRGQYFYYIF